MATTLYPTRTRCFACRKKLDDVIIDGMFCSYKCAKVKAPSQKVADAPRHCKREVGGKWDFKTRYTHEEAVPLKWRQDPATNIYRCDYCHYLHIGHSRPQQDIPLEKLSRTVRDIETLGSVIKRMRETKNWDKKVLAKKLNVPIIRITEIEESNPKMNVEVLFKVLQALRLTLNLSER